MASPRRFMNSVHATFPDDQTTKEVSVQADGLSWNGLGDRHVLLWWENGSNDDDDGKAIKAIQVIQLTGNPGNYAYFAPLVISVPSDAPSKNEQFPLGEFTRAQRDRVLELAKCVEFERTSVVNNCRVWTRDLLVAMLDEGMIGEEAFKKANDGVPLLERKPEA